MRATYEGSLIFLRNPPACNSSSGFRRSPNMVSAMRNKITGMP